MSKQLTSHYRQATTEMLDQSKGRKKYWWQIIRFKNDSV